MPPRAVAALCALLATPSAAQAALFNFDDIAAEAGTLLSLPEGVAEGLESGVAIPAQALADDDDMSILERFNRTMFRVNLFTDDVVLSPLTQVYTTTIPSAARRAVANVLANVDVPVTLAHDILQGETDRAETSLKRLTINTTLGLGGMLDVASELDIPPHEEDLGQTFARYGIPEGPYVVLPLLGGSTLRHAAGRVGDGFASPWRYALAGLEWYEQMAPAAAGALVGRERSGEFIDAMKRSGGDVYAVARDAYLANRAYEIRNGVVSDAELMELPDLPEDDDAYEETSDDDDGAAT